MPFAEDTSSSDRTHGLESKLLAHKPSPRGDFSDDDDDEHAPGVIESGKEQTGRWTRAEHQAFLFALNQYGKEWKKVAAHVKTRTVVQTRTHAQKYFQKLQKGLSMDQGDVLMETVIEAEKMIPIIASRRPSSAKKKNGAKRDALLLPIQNSSTLKKENEATQAAAQLMSQISKVHSTHRELDATPRIDPYANPQVSYAETRVDSTPHSLDTSRNDTSSFTYKTPMRISVPRPGFTMEKNMFPEPSPAACGKRKILELETANTLLGVGSSGGQSYSLASKEPGNPGPPSSFLNVGGSGSKQIIHSQIDSCSSTSTAEKCDKLHIILPDHIQNEHNNKRMGMKNEPVTPWDIELEALKSEFKVDVIHQAANTNEANSDHSRDEEVTDEMQTLDSDKRQTLHAAVCAGSIQKVNDLLHWLSQNLDSHSRLALLNSADKNGFTPLHLAVIFEQGESDRGSSRTMAQMLISAGASVGCIDNYGNSPLHWATRSGCVDSANLLVLEGCSLDLRNDMGETPLHWAMRLGSKGLGVTRFLLENGARSLYNKAFQRPLDLAAKGFQDICYILYPIAEIKSHKVDSDNITEKRITRENFFVHCPQARTLVLHHPDCLEHVPKFETDWECPARIESIIDPLINGQTEYIRDYEIQITNDFEKASLEFLSRVHSAEYLTFVNKLSKELEQKEHDSSENKSVVPFTPMVQRSIMRESQVKKGAHSDTSFSSGSLKAARRAAGAVKHAIDCVLVGRNRNAFCVVRPPGHHAGVNGLLDGAESCGFCIFNNVAAGAMHALSDELHGRKCERVAIIDIDVHHGNGTEEIVRKCDEPGRLFFFSVHLYDNDKKKSNPYKFYPGTGVEDDVAHNVINVPIAPMWKEKSKQKIVTLNSIRDRQHNTRHKSKSIQSVREAETNILKYDSLTSENDLSPSASSVDIENQMKTELSDTNIQETSPAFLYGTGRDAYRKAIQQRLLPALRAFNPDLILISIGLDAAKDDVGNARHFRNGKEYQGINLTPEDYAWSTAKILEVADICCHGRVVSILEGGYGKSNVGRAESDASSSVFPSPSPLDKSTLSECALHHLRALIDPHDVEMI